MNKLLPGMATPEPMMEPAPIVVSNNSSQNNTNNYSTNVARVTPIDTSTQNIVNQN